MERAKGTFSNQAACYYQSNHSKVEAIPLTALPKNTTSKLSDFSPHYPVNAKCQAGKM